MTVKVLAFVLCTVAPPRGRTAVLQGRFHHWNKSRDLNQLSCKQRDLYSTKRRFFKIFNCNNDKKAKFKKCFVQSKLITEQNTLATQVRIQISRIAGSFFGIFCLFWKKKAPFSIQKGKSVWVIKVKLHINTFWDCSHFLQYKHFD